MGHGSNPARHLFLYSLQAKNVLYIFKWLGEKNQKKTHLSWHEKLHEIQISALTTQTLPPFMDGL